MFIKSTDGAKIYYETNVSDSKKPCIVFIHGLAGAVNVWNTEMDFFKADGVQTVAIDLRGHGNSERSEKQNFYKFDNFVSDVTQVIKKEGLKSYCLVGHSLGGMVSLAVAAKNSTGLKELVLLDAVYKSYNTFGSFNNPSLLKLFLNYFINKIPNIRIVGSEDYESFKGTGNVDLRRGISDILHVSLRDYLLICSELIGTDLTNLLNKISIPTLIIEGEKDSLVPPEVAHELKDRIKKSELEMIENANHFLIINNSIDISRDIERFLIKRHFI